MRFFLRFILLLTIVGSILCGTTGCNNRRAARPKFQIVSVDRVQGGIGRGWQLTITAANNTASTLQVTDGTATIYDKGRKVANIVLDGDVSLPRRKCSQVVVPLRIALSNPIGAISIMNRIRKGEYNGITLDYKIVVKAFTSHREVSERGIALEDIAQKFNFGLK